MVAFHFKYFENKKFSTFQSAFFKDNSFADSDGLTD